MSHFEDVIGVKSGVICIQLHYLVTWNWNVGYSAFTLYKNIPPLFFAFKKLSVLLVFVFLVFLHSFGFSSPKSNIAIYCHSYFSATNFTCPLCLYMHPFFYTYILATYEYLFGGTQEHMVSYTNLIEFIFCFFIFIIFCNTWFARRKNK